MAVGWSPAGSYSEATRNGFVTGLAGCFSGMNSTGADGRVRTCDMAGKMGAGRVEGQTALAQPQRYC